MEPFGVLVRWAHVLAASLVVGVFAFLVLVGRPAARAAGPESLARFAGLDARLVRLGGWALGLALASGALDLWRQLSVATGLGLRESLTPEAVEALLFQTRYGAVWLLRHGLLALLGVFLVFREETENGADRLALRLEGLALGLVSLVAVGAAGHAASTGDASATAIAVDAVHLLATGVWLGGLLPLALFLRWTLSTEAAGVRAAAAAARRFSAIGLGGVSLLAVTGVYNAWEQVGALPALLATPYGQWLGLKLLLLVVLLLLAALNLRVVVPRLAGEARCGEGGSGSVRRLRRHVLAEVAVGAAILGVVALLGLTTPARHAPLTWPFPFRLDWQATKDLPGVQTRVAVGSQLATLGLVGALLAAVVRRRRWRWVMTGGVAAVALGLLLGLPPLAIDANPATYLRPAVPYAAASVAHGLALYRTHCASCHGADGYGDGPAGAGLRPPPANLTARHTADHTVGDLFWWLGRGIRGSAMRGFADRLSEEDRWDLVNFLRTLAAAERTRALGPVAAPRPSVVAPDFAFTTGVGEGHALKDYRGRGVVLLVLFSLPDSLDRLVELGGVYRDLRLLGAEVLAIPLRPSRDLYRRLGGRPIFYPLVVDGAAEAATTYALFARHPDPAAPPSEAAWPAHLELLVDRQGYLRARWLPGAAEGWDDPARLVAEVQRLTGETAQAPPADEHVH